MLPPFTDMDIGTTALILGMVLLAIGIWVFSDDDGPDDPNWPGVR